MSADAGEELPHRVDDRRHPGRRVVADAVRFEAVPRAGHLDEGAVPGVVGGGDGSRISSGRPNGSDSPCTTSSGARAPASSSTRDASGRPGGCNGNESATTPMTSCVAAQRQAMRAPALRPPTTSGTEGHRVATASTAGAQASSRRGGLTATLRPASRHGWEYRTTVTPAAGRTSARARRSKASTPPPAPCPRRSTVLGAPVASATTSRPGPCTVSTVRSMPRSCHPGPRHPTSVEEVGSSRPRREVATPTAAARIVSPQATAKPGSHNHT